MTNGGSAEYNLGLGDRRASAAKEFLQGLGVPADRIKTISYGKGTSAVYRAGRNLLAEEPAASTSWQDSRISAVG